MEREDNRAERRANIRLSRVLAVALQTAEGEVSCVAVDLSVSGFQVASPVAVEPGNIMELQLHLERHCKVATTAKVVWCEELSSNLFRTGFQIEEVSSVEDFERLCGFIEKERLNVAGLPRGDSPALELLTQVSLRSMSEAELERFSALASVSRMLNNSTSLQELLQKTLQVMVEVTGAERGMMLLDRGGAELDAQFFHTKTDNESREFSRSVVEKVLVNMEPLLSLDAQKDERLAESSSLRLMGTRSVLCVPISTRNHDIGTLYVDNSVRAGALTQFDLKLATILAEMAAAAIERAEDFAELVHREKLATIGTMTASLLHELTNPLTTILGLGELLQCDVGGETTQLLVDEARRCKRLVKDLLGFSRKDSAEMSRVDINEVIKKTAASTAAEFARNRVKLTIQVDDGIAVYGNQAHLRQIILNLFTNAAQAAGVVGNGVVEVRGRARGEDCILTVADNGPGIPPQDLRRVFDPFFTTKEPGQGTGLGLSIIARLVREHQGAIRAENRPDGGAVFQLTLPLASPPDMTIGSA